MDVRKNMFRWMVIPILGLACLPSHLLYADTVRGVSGPTFVDTTCGARFSSGAALLAYATVYTGKANTNDTDYVVLKKVVDFDTTSATTSTVVQCAAGVAGDYQIDADEAGAHRVRLLHTAYNAGDTQIGDTLAADIVFPLASASNATSVNVDTRADSLQLVADAGGPAPLAYSTDWCTNGVAKSVEITCAREMYEKNGRLVSARTNSVFSANSPATGDFLHQIRRGSGGTFKLFCTFKDENGNVLGDQLTAWYRFTETYGLIFTIK